MGKASVWKKFLKGASSAVALAIFALIAYAECYLLISTSFFDQVKGRMFWFSFLTMILLAVEIVLTIYFVVLFFLSIYKKETKKSGVIIFGAEILTVLTGTATVMVMFFGGATSTAFYRNALPYFIVGLAAVVFLFLLPLAKKKRYLLLIAAVASVAIIGGVSGLSLKREKFAFEEAPAVFDTGSDFSVVWCTNEVSIGYLEYVYGGEKYTVYDAEDGKYKADKRVHTVHVPYEHLYGNTYTVSAAEVIRNTPYTSKTGEFITSDAYSFAAKPEGEKLTMISASDWHQDVESLEKAVSACKEFDLFIMMGDPANYFDEYDDILNYVVLPGGNCTKGVKPILYVRGNHEPRGKYAGYLKEVLGYENYYYTTSYGKQNFIVFDGGEDKEDTHTEYGGLIASEDYRKKELEYMDSLPVLEGNNVCLCHMPDYSISSDEEGCEKFRSILEKQNVKLEISGHEHDLKLREKDGCMVLIDGGPLDDGYVLCYIEMENDVATVEAVSEKGNTIKKYGPIALQ